MARIFTYNPAEKDLECFFYLPLSGVKSKNDTL